MAPNWTHLIRFLAEEDGQTHLGQLDPQEWPDVGRSLERGERVRANLIRGCAFDGVLTDEWRTVKWLLPPLRMDEVPIIRCMGLNYRDHAKEANMAIPDVPVLFIKPRTAINGPDPAKINIPKIAQDGTSDYEAELSVIISKTGRDIPKEKALDYVLGYACSNDVSARAQQFKNSQWCFSKGRLAIIQSEPRFLKIDDEADEEHLSGFDGSCPIGPVIVHPSAIPDAHKLRITATVNGRIVQDSNTRQVGPWDSDRTLLKLLKLLIHGCSEMIFDVPSIISFLSQGTTLERGTIIMTGTGPGIGAAQKPPMTLNDGDDVRVEIERIGTLINTVYFDK